MANRQWRWYARIACGLVMIPAAVWLLIVLVAPTGWAKSQVVSRLEARSGRRVALGQLSVGLLGRIHLSGLEIGSPRDTGDPWLKADDVRLDFGIWQMLRGHCRPQRVEVNGVALRVLRRADGSVELADLIPPAPAEGSGESHSPDPRVAIQVRHARVTVQDEPTGTHVVLDDVEGEGYGQGPLAVVEQMRGTVNGGEFQFAARMDRTASAMGVRAQFRADGVALDEGMRILRYAVPVLAGAPPTVKGRLNTNVFLEGTGPSWQAVIDSVSGHGVVELKPIDLDESPLATEICRLTDLGGSRRSGAVHTDFVYERRRISTDHFTLNIGRLPMTLSGWTDFDGRVDYRMKIEGLNQRLPEGARRILRDLKVDTGSLTALTLRGTINQMVVQVNGVAIDRNLLREAGANLRPDDRERVRQITRDLRSLLR